MNRTKFMKRTKFIKLKLKFVPNLLVKMEKALDKPSHITIQEEKTVKKITTHTQHWLRNGATHTSPYRLCNQCATYTTPSSFSHTPTPTLIHFTHTSACCY